jgi:hypothetical protein
MGNVQAGQGIAYFKTKDFDAALSKAFMSGGQQQKKARKVKEVLGSIDQADPFAGLPVTNHGETRIANAVKYDLGDGWRLVTAQNGKACTFIFVGDHDDTDKWLDRHKGFRAGVQNQRAIIVPGSGHLIVQSYLHKAEHHYTALVDRLAERSVDEVLDGLPRSICKRLEALDAHSDTDHIYAIVADIEDGERSEFVRAVFTLLLAGDEEGAQAHIDLKMGRIDLLNDLDEADFLSVADGEDIRRLRIGSPDYERWLAAFEKRTNWYEWFTFLHPEQESVVNADYKGTAQLSGVSGSGKTCVAVRRALRLAEAENAKVLVLTLNRSLAGLLKQLVDSVCVDDGIRSRIHVTSFFELAQRLLHEFEPDNDKLYADVTWKLDEHVDFVFREYYRQWLNNSAASVLQPLHKSMTARGVSGESYLREEFDWIRSAVRPSDRATYLTIERKGRKFPIVSDRRTDILTGLRGWEAKMRDVGVIDYLGLTSALAQHLEAISASFTNVIVDEAQDFGTTEFQIVRRLVEPGPNDIFLCGDIAQTILPKHRSLADAGVTGVTRERIQKNYRNSREILKAAYEVLKNNLVEDMFDSGDLEILDPKFANFSGPVPMALAASTLEEEIAFARAFAETSDAKTICIAFAGFSSRDVKGFADICGIPALDGGYDPKSDRVVFCDMEQTKGYEFDTLIIVNCTNIILPPYDAPKEEAHRASCKLYVAMTRAKKELILSFHGQASSWIIDVSGTIGTGMWDEYESHRKDLMAGVPESLPETDPDQSLGDSGALPGLQFLYTSHALNLSSEAQEKLIELVDGKGLMAAGGSRRLKWRNMASLLSDLNSTKRHDNLFGPSVVAELRALPKDSGRVTRRQTDRADVSESVWENGKPNNSIRY